MNKKKWIQEATKNKGGLHRALGVSEDKNLTAKQILMATHKPGKVGKEARLAQTLAKMRKKK